jgi:hypothetical protein
VRVVLVLARRSLLAWVWMLLVLMGMMSQLGGGGMIAFMVVGYGGIWLKTMAVLTSGWVVASPVLHCEMKWCYPVVG